MHTRKWMLVRRRRVSWLLRQEQILTHWLCYGNLDKLPEAHDVPLPKNTHRYKSTDNDE